MKGEIKGTARGQVEARLLDLKSETGILLTGGNNREESSHILADRTMKLNDSLVEAKKKTGDALAF